MRTALVVVSLLVVPVIAVGGVPGTDVDPAATNGSTGEDASINRIAHLTLGDDANQGLANQSVDVASAVTIGRDDAAARLGDYATEERLDRTDGTNATVEAALEDLDAKVTALEADVRAAGARYANGSTSRSAFVTRVAHHQARAERLDARLSRLDDMAAEHGTDAHRDRIERLQRRLLGNAGPVRGDALAALTGEGADLELYVAGSPDGVVLARIDGRTYVRDAFRADRRKRPPEGMTILEAIHRFEELYPVATGLSGSVKIEGVNGNETYAFEKGLPLGSLRSYLDGNTRDVSHEIQRRDLDAMDQPASVTETANGTRLVLNRTHVGGPIRVATYEAGTRNVTDTVVRVGDRRLETGGDGVAWTIMPPRQGIDVTAIAPNGTVTLTAEPITLTPVNASSVS